jgi:HNH endonuclease
MVGRWVRIDRRYNQPYRLTGYAVRVIFKWTGLGLAWVFVNAALTASHLSALVLATTAGIIWYAVHCARRNRRPRLTEPTYSPALPAASQWPSAQTSARWWQSAPFNGQWQLNPPPNWPSPPPGWSPELGWQPDPSWPPPPPGWQLWVPASAPGRGAPGERNSRVIPQDVKIAVSVRDQGKCVQCGSTEDLHFDHKVPWSRGGTNTVNNIQLLCGPCNRRKGADDIPF